jgi:hypothetical protein
MARKKDPAKPLLAVKGDFIAALDNLMHESLMLTQAVDMAIQHGQLPETTAGILRERITAFKAALFTGDAE